MDLIHTFWYFITHLNTELPFYIAAHGDMVYGLLFAIIFIETGLVIMPFLPGDSLLFVAGSLAALGVLNLGYLIGLLILAAVLGDNINYAVGRFFGAHVTQWKLFGRSLVRPKDLEKTHAYFERYGVKTIIIARFVPIVRTVTPFVAGVGKMSYRNKFLPFDVLGGISWITLLLLAGFLFGQHPFVKKHYEMVILGIVFISVLPMIIAYLRMRMVKKPA